MKTLCALFLLAPISLHAKARKTTEAGEKPPKEISVPRVVTFVGKHPQKTGRAVKHTISEVVALKRSITPALKTLKEFPDHLSNILGGVLGLVGAADEALDAFIPMLQGVENRVTNELVELDPSLQESIATMRDDLEFTSGNLKQTKMQLTETKERIDAKREVRARRASS